LIDSCSALVIESDSILVILQKGFTYHHAENEYAVLSSWISDLPNTIPANASHRIGIGALVLNKNREVTIHYYYFIFLLA